jgi:predicted CoA-binding protein
MAKVPTEIEQFLACKRIAVAGVSRNTGEAANAVYRKLRGAGYEVFATNPNAAEVEGTRCYPDLAAIPGGVDGVVIATRPDVSVDVVRQCSQLGIDLVWFHRSFGEGSVSEAAVRECEARGIRCIVGGCPLMYCKPVDLGHRCMRWVLRLQARVPG